MATQKVTLKEIKERVDTEYQKAVEANDGKALGSKDFKYLVQNCFMYLGVDYDDGDQGSKWYKHVFIEFGSKGGSATHKNKPKVMRTPTGKKSKW